VVLRPPQVGLVEFLHSAIVWSLPWTPLWILAIAGALRGWQARAVRFAFLWFAVPFLALMMSSHQKGGPRARAPRSWRPGGPALMGPPVARSAVTSVALHVPAWWGSEERGLLLDVPGHVLFTLIVGIGRLMAGALFWGLQAGRPALLVHGVMIGMVIVWGSSLWPLTKHYNELWNFRELAASVAQHARGAEVAIYQHRDKWGPIEFYLGRSRSLYGGAGQRTPDPGARRGSPDGRQSLECA
jgi:TM2 domain-containing membrane protein YozV